MDTMKSPKINVCPKISFFATLVRAIGKEVR